MTRRSQLGTLVAGLVVVMGVGSANASGLGLVGGACGKCPCPPPLKWTFEPGPRICYKRGCPKPICDPCTLEHFGYYQTCWSPWPYPPNWSHCPTPPPGEMLPPPAYPPYSPKAPAPRQQFAPPSPAGELPAPTPMTPKNENKSPSVRLLLP